MKWQIISDIHLELRKQAFEFEAKAPYLAMLGDIGDPFDEPYTTFLAQQSHRFERVFILAGNHEYYGHSIEKTDERIHNICQNFSNVHFLNMQSHMLERHIVLGCTLWSLIDPAFSDVITRRLRDFHQISEMTLDKYLSLHHKHKQWLSQQLHTHSHQPVIVFTHHAPVIRSGNPIFFGSPLTSAFANNLENLIAPPIKLWAWGHTHWSLDRVFNGTRLFSHQIGYEQEVLPRPTHQGYLELNGA